MKSKEELEKSVPYWKERVDNMEYHFKAYKAKLRKKIEEATPVVHLTNDNRLIDALDKEDILKLIK